MKKTKSIFFIFLFILILNTKIISKGFDFSFGGSYRIGYHYSLNYLSGLHQQFSGPVLFSYYPFDNYLFSFGIRNKIAYGITIYNNVKTFSSAFSYSTITYKNLIPQHELYENLSFIIKVGHQVKFLTGIGLSLKYNVLPVPDNTYEILLETISDDPEINFDLLAKGDHKYFSFGPSLDFNIEIIKKMNDKLKTLSIIIGLPVEFLFSLNNINKFNIKSVVTPTSFNLQGSQASQSFFDFSIGTEIIISFYTYKTQTVKNNKN